jgi:hypothetical protein
MVGKEKYLNHSDFTTVLLGPSHLRIDHPKECSEFDEFIPYEDIVFFIPQFRL